MGRECKPIGKDGRIRLHFDEVQIIRKALRKLLFSDKEKREPSEDMLIISTYQKLIYRENGKRSKNKDNKVNPINNKG